MHPALSVILFTTASGAGYGLLALFGILDACGLLPEDRWSAGAALGLALGLVSAGLLSSTAHLGRPERAWRAVSQWRTSWLSREGVLALATYPPALAFGIGRVVLDGSAGWVIAAGLAASLLAILTVACTAMIYASLKPVHQWRNGWVLPNYLALGLMTGALCLAATLRFRDTIPPAGSLALMVTIVIAAALKLAYWRFIDRTKSAATPESALGLTGGTARPLDPPHTEANYLMKEMGFTIARKHAARLRRIALAAGFALPFAATLFATVLPGPGAAVLAALAALSALCGILVERWLFFAEARHTVMLYYGAEAA